MDDLCPGWREQLDDYLHKNKWNLPVVDFILQAAADQYQVELVIYREGSVEPRRINPQAGTAEQTWYFLLNIHGSHFNALYTHPLSLSLSLSVFVYFCFFFFFFFFLG